MSRTAFAYETGAGKMRRVMVDPRVLRPIAPTHRHYRRSSAEWERAC